MKVILASNIKRLGKVGDLVKVKDGFARNFLFPNSMALRENKKNLEYFEKIKEEITVKEQERKQEAENLLKNLKDIKIEFFKEVDEKDQLYGAISKKEILNFLMENKIKLLSDDLKIEKPIRSIGKHEIIVTPYQNLEEKIVITGKKSK